MKIIVLSCDKNENTFKPFHHCLEKYYPNHPEVIYLTETIQNPYYRTIPVSRDINQWTKGVREFLDQIDDDIVLLMIDDIFIRKPVDECRIDSAVIILKLEDNLACLDFEKAWDNTDLHTDYAGWNCRNHGAEFEVSLMCGLWDRKKLIKVLGRDCDPWTIELQQQPCGFDYYINSGDYIIDWGYRTFQPCGIVKGKWTKECLDFLASEGIIIQNVT